MQTKKQLMNSLPFVYAHLKVATVANGLQILHSDLILIF